jgi:putative FmdB family regulatory protein
MPLYEYKCQSCGKKFEVIQKFSDEPLTTHPECGGPAEKLFSAPAFHLKGTGWYATDYAKTSTSPSAKNEEGKTGEGKSNDSPASSESKPAASETKSETKPDPKPSTPAPATT